MFFYNCKKKIFLFGIIALYSFVSVSQDYNNFESIKSKGIIPNDFYTLSSEKFKNQSQKEISKEDKRKVAKSKESFLLKSNFVLDELLTSGDVLFNDSLSDYVNKVADEILKENPKLRSEIRFYVVKSPHVNAFSTAQGYVLVNIGLLAQIENEAQLAYILCHEIIHYTNKHAISQKVNYDTEIKKAKTNSYDKMLASSAYSKELESEADIEGLDLYMKTSYSKEIFEDVFNVLKYSYLPFNEVPYSYDYLESSLFKIRQVCKLDSVNPVSFKHEENEDELSTHPNIDKRIADIKKKVETYKVEERGKNYILEEAYFKRINTIARHELSQLFMREKNYGASLYNSFLLQYENPNNIYAKVQTLYALYYLTKYANRNELNEVVKFDNEIEGESHRVYFMLHSMTAEEINIIALNYAFKLKLELKDDPIINGICEDLVVELIDKNELGSSSFMFEHTPKVLKERKEINRSDTTFKQFEPQEKSFRYLKIKEIEEKVEQSTSQKNERVSHAFSDLCFNDDFEVFFKSVETKFLNLKNLKESKKHRENQLAENKLNRKKGYALGLEKVVIVDPEYYKIDERKKESIEYIDAETYKNNNKEIIEGMAQTVGLEMDYLNPTDMTGKDIEKFNDMALLNRWLKEKSQHDFLSVSIYQREIDELCIRKGVSVASWMGTISIHVKKDNLGKKIFYCALVPYLWPAIPVILIRQEHKTYYYNVSYNLQSGEKVLVELKDFNSKDLKHILKSNAYESMVQLKAKRK